ncbi:MAG: DUF975 family protein [Oscillospiraceae bacterium]|nr:DUF975 family protein [Oscillospiraceae bacterium]
MFDRKQLKSESKELVRRGGGKVFAVVVLFLLVTFVFTFLTLRLEGIKNIERQYREMMTAAQQVDAADPEAVQEYMNSYANTSPELPQPGFGARAITLLLNVVSGLLAMGLTWWALKATRGFIDKFSSIFDVFGNFGRAILLLILKGVIIAAGLMLFIVPGVYLAICYSQSEYILFENPDLGAVDCLRKSRLLMREHTAEYLVLNLSFIGWFILISFAAGFVGAALFMAGTDMTTPALAVSMIGLIWLLPYYEFTMAGYYNYLTGYAPAGAENENEIEGETAE